MVALQKQRGEEENLEKAVQDLETAIIHVEDSLERIENTVEPLEHFKNTGLEAVPEKMSKVFDVLPSVTTPRMDQLYENAESLRQRFAILTNKLEEKLAEAKDQEALAKGIHEKLAQILQSCKDLEDKYTNLVDLPTAVEDVNQLQSLLDTLEEMNLDALSDCQSQNRLGKERDQLKTRLRVRNPSFFKNCTFLLFFLGEEG